MRVLRVNQAVGPRMWRALGYASLFLYGNFALCYTCLIVILSSIFLWLYAPVLTK